MHESPRDRPVEAPLPPELGPYLVLETESATAPSGSSFQGWWVLAWQSTLPVLQIEKGRSHAVGRCMTLQGDGHRETILEALAGARLFITTERHWLADAARLAIPTIWVADGRPDCSELTGHGELAPDTGLPPESVLFEPGLFRAVFSHTAYRRELPLRRIFEAVNQMAPGLLHEDLSESSACRARMLPHLRGRIADIGHGGCKILPQARGVDFFQFDESDWIGDARDLWFFDDQHFDSVYSSHCLEDLWHPHQALEEWTRILRVGGRLCLYLPLKDHYPNVGMPGCNPGHKDDYVPLDVEGFLRDLGHMDLLVSERREDEDSFEVVAQKRQGRSFFLLREERPTPLVSVLVPGPCSKEPREDARSLLACIESAHASLQEIPHEILVLDRSTADGDARAGLRDVASRHPEIQILEDRSPRSWPRRLTPLLRRAQGEWLCVLDGQSLVLDRALARLVDRARSEGAVAAIPRTLDRTGQVLYPEIPACVLVQREAGMLEDTEETAFLTGLHLRHGLDQLEKAGRKILHLDQACILHEGLPSQTLSTIKLAPRAFDQRLRSHSIRPPFESERILLTQFRTLGDCVLGTPILEGLKERDPHCHITVLTEDRYAWIFENHPYCDALSVVPALEDKGYAIQEDAALLQYLQSRDQPGFDRLLILSDQLDQPTYHQSGSSLASFYAQIAGIPEASEIRPRVFLSQERRDAARALLDSEGITGPYCVLHRKSGWSNKDLNPELTAEICRAIHGEQQLPIVQIGGPGEGITYPGLLDLCGRLEASLSAAIIEQASLHVGPDSGPLHLASSFDVPTLGIYAGSGIRVAPPLAWRSMAVQSPSSCAVSCGIPICTQRRPCAKDLDPGQIQARLRTLLQNEAIRAEFCGGDEALYISSPAGDRWIHRESLPEGEEHPKLARPESVLEGPPLEARIQPLERDVHVLPVAADLQQAWIRVLQAKIAEAVSGIRTDTQKQLESTLDSLPAWTVVETIRSLATRARRGGDLRAMFHWLMKAVDRCDGLVQGRWSRPRRAFRIIADELFFDLCHALQSVEDRVPHLVDLLQRYRETHDRAAPQLPVLAALTAADGLPATPQDQRALSTFLEPMIEKPETLPQTQLILLAMALTRIGQESQALDLLETRLQATPAGRRQERAELSVRVGFLLAEDPQRLEQARDCLLEASQGLEDEAQRTQVESLLARIDRHIGDPEVATTLQPAQPRRQTSRTYKSGSLNVKEFSSIEDLAQELDWMLPGRLLEPDLDVVENECEEGGRKRHDAEVLCWMAANMRGDILDLGTSHGRSAFKFASNQRRGEIVHTVNALPEQIRDGETHITHKVDAEAIGSWYRDRGIQNVRQIFANTLEWNPDKDLRDLACVFVDANHDGAAVFSDSRKTWTLLREGGYLIWHDFCPEKRDRYDWIDSVMGGIEAFLRAEQLDCEVLHLAGSWIGMIRKTAPTAQPKTQLEHI